MDDVHQDHFLFSNVCHCCRKLLLGLDNVALDLDDHAGFVDGIGGDGDSLGEAADVVGVVAHADFAALARHDGLLGPFRSGAAAACSNAGEDEGFVAGVGEGEHAVAVATLLYGAIIICSELGR